MSKDAAPDGGAEAERANELLAQLLAEGELSEEELVNRLLTITEANPEANGSDWQPAIASPDGQSIQQDQLDALQERLSEVATLEDRLTDVEEHLSELATVEERIDAVGDEFQAKLEDVRERVIQVKRETDAKALADHHHEEIEELAGSIDQISGQIDEMEARFDKGFENYETILEYLTETTDDLDEQLDLLAGAVIDLRDEVDILGRHAAHLRRLQDLSEAANANGVRRARCDDCRGKVDIGLLTEPRCPHCKSIFSHLEASSGFFGTSTLHTDDAPALEGDTADRTELDAVFTGAGDPDAPDVNVPADAPPEEEGDEAVSEPRADVNEDPVESPGPPYTKSDDPDAPN